MTLLYSVPGPESKRNINILPDLMTVKYLLFGLRGDKQALGDEWLAANHVCFFSIAVCCNGVKLAKRGWWCVVLNWKEFSTVLSLSASSKESREKRKLCEVSHN